VRKIFIAGLALLLVLAACANPQPPEDTITTTTTALYEPELPPSPEFELSESVQAALEEFLGEMLPVFTRNEYEFSDWWSFFYWDETTDTISFLDPATEESVFVGDTPWLTELSSVDWAIAAGFALYDLDDNGIPAVVMGWGSRYDFGSGDGGFPATLHRYVDGSYEFAGDLWIPFDFYRDQQGRALVHLYGFIDPIVRLSLIDGMTIEPLIEYNWEWDEAFEEFHVDVRNHMTNEHFTDSTIISEWYRDIKERGHIPGMPDEPLMPIEQLPGLKHALTERITARLLAEGRILPPPVTPE